MNASKKTWIISLKKSPQAYWRIVTTKQNPILRRPPLFSLTSQTSLKTKSQILTRSTVCTSGQKCNHPSHPLAHTVKGSQPPYLRIERGQEMSFPRGMAMDEWRTPHSTSHATSHVGLGRGKNREDCVGLFRALIWETLGCSLERRAPLLKDLPLVQIFACWLGEKWCKWVAKV